MLSRISFDYLGATDHFDRYRLTALDTQISAIHMIMQDDARFHLDEHRWPDHLCNFDKETLVRIQRTAARITNTSDLLLVIGLDETSVGVVAAKDVSVTSDFPSFSKGQSGTMISFVPPTLSDLYVQQVKDALKEQDISIFYVSEAQTNEAMHAFRFFRQLLRKKYGEKEAEERIYTSSPVNYDNSPLPKSDTRYQLFAPAGLLPMAMLGVDIELLMQGAQLAHRELANASLSDNGAYQYAAVRHLLYEERMDVEWLISKDFRLHAFGEWRRWLFGSDGIQMDGRERNRLFPSFATSRKEYLALRNFMVENREDAVLTDFRVNGETGIPSILRECTGDVPMLVFDVPRMDLHTFGYLLYFFEKASVMEGYLKEQVVQL